jgi:hypothetical protein
MLSALLFAVHPVNVENVVWISERKTLLATFYFFLSFILYLSFRKNRSCEAYTLAILLYAAALLSKVAVVTLPLQLIVYEMIFCRERRRWMPIVPFFVLSGMASVMAVLAQVGGKAIDKGLLVPGVLINTVYPTMAPVFWKYIGLLLWPVHLSGFYDTTIYHSFLELPVLLSLLGCAFVAVIVFAKGGAQGRFWFLWFLIFLLPVSNIVPLPVFYADRYLYIAELGFFAIIFSLTASIPKKAAIVVRSFVSKREASLVSTENPVNLKDSTLIKWAKGVVWSFFIAAFVFYGLTAYKRVDVWRTEISFWEDTVKKSPGIYKAHQNLGVIYDENGRFNEAEREYLLAYALEPTDEVARNIVILRAKMKTIVDQTR